MSITSLAPTVYPGNQFALFTTAPGTSNFSMSASDSKIAYILYAPQAGNISKIHFRISSVTTGDTIKGSLQDVSTSTGLPDEVVDQSGTVVISGQNQWYTITLDSARTVTTSEIFAVVLEFDSYVSGNFNIAYNSSQHQDLVYVATKAASVWTKRSNAPMILVEYSDTSIPYMSGTIAATGSSVDFSSSTTAPWGDEIGVCFIPPTTVQINGVLWGGQLNGDQNIILYDGNNTAQRTIFVDKDITSASTRIGRSVWFDPYTLTAGMTYRAVIQPTTTTTTRLYYLTLRSSSDMAAVAGISSSNWCLTFRVDGGSWTDSTTQTPVIGFYVTGIDGGSGGTSLSRVVNA